MLGFFVSHSRFTSIPQGSSPLDDEPCFSPGTPSCSYYNKGISDFCLFIPNSSLKERSSRSVSRVLFMTAIYLCFSSQSASSGRTLGKTGSLNPRYSALLRMGLAKHTDCSASGGLVPTFSPSRKK